MSDRLPSGLEVAKKYVISVGMDTKNVCGWPWKCGKRIAIGVLQTSWGAPLGASASRSGKGAKVQVQKPGRNRSGLESRGQMGRLSQGQMTPTSLGSTWVCE